MRNARAGHALQLLALLWLSALASGAACIEGNGGEPDAGYNLDRPIIGLNCGEPASVGNAIGIGQHCVSTSDCPVAETGTTIQCSTVLTDDSLPLLCSRLCGSVDGGSIDCGEDAVCHNIIQLGYDLDVCVPRACESLFDGGLPDEAP